MTKKVLFPPGRSSEPADGYTAAVPKPSVGAMRFAASFAGMGLRDISVEILQRHLREVREHERLSLMVSADPQILASHGTRPTSEKDVLDAIAVLGTEKDPLVGELLAQIAAIGSFQSVRDAAMKALEAR